MTVQLRNMSDQVLLSAETRQAGRFRRTGMYRHRIKRVLDVALVLLTAPISVPLTMLFAALVALDGHNPFYYQERVGRDGRVFKIWKLRSMVPDAEALLATHIAENRAARAEWEATQKLRYDPRITRLGNFIRRASIDELPQLLNVLTGEMSLVGPRPMMVSQTSLYPGTAYFKLRPGITGFWQISDRNTSEFKGRAEHDQRYYDEVSFRTDFSILIATVGVVLRCTGY